MLIVKTDNTGEFYDEREFTAALETLMYEHGVHSVTAHWSIPVHCPSCGTAPILGVDSELITMLKGDDPRLEGAEVILKSEIDRELALDMLKKHATENRDEMAISLELPKGAQ